MAVILTGAWLSFTIHKKPKLSIATGLLLYLFSSYSINVYWAIRKGGDRVYWHGTTRAIRTLIKRGDANDVVLTIDAVLPSDVTYNDDLRNDLYEKLREVDPGLVK